MPKLLSRLLSLALVAIAPVAAATPCLPGSLQDYIDLGASCEIGTASFAGFEVVSGPAGATPIDPAAIQVTPTGSASDPGLMFVLNIAASASQFFDALIHFQVTSALGVSLTGARATIDGASATEDGAVTLIEDLCVDGLFSPLEPSGCPGTTATLIAFAIEGIADPDIFVTPLKALSFFDVFVDIGIDGGILGTAALGSATVRFATSAAPVPEPPSLPLALVALALLAALSRRRTSRTAR